MSEKLLLELYERLVVLEGKVAALEKFSTEKPVESQSKSRSVKEVRGKYRYLADYLANCQRDIVDLTFDELEEIIKSKLPESCRKHRAIWANSNSHSIAVAWIAAGYRTTDVNIKEKKVRFERR